MDEKNSRGRGERGNGYNGESNNRQYSKGYYDESNNQQK